MGVPTVSWLAVAPALLPAAGAVLVLAVDAAFGRRARRVLDAVALLSVVGGLTALVPLAQGTRRTFS